ncbi:MAG: CapA family protein [Ornithinimicrobium sp.]
MKVVPPCGPGSSVVAVVLAVTACAGGDQSVTGTEQARSDTARETHDGPESTSAADATELSPTSTVSPSEQVVTIAASGDVLAHVSVLDSAATYAHSIDQVDFDFDPMFAQIRPMVSAADVALCHLETPLSARNVDLTRQGVLSFNTPHELAADLAQAGYDGCDFASNHTMDRGLPGLAQTQATLTEAGLGHAGPTAEEKSAGRPALYEAGEVTVAHLAYTYTLPNSGGPTTTVPDEAPWLAESLWPVVGSRGIADDAMAARAGGADVVVASLHWGQEYRSEPTSDQTQIAHALLESGAVDLILGTHVHVPQPCEQINGRYVLYGMGNSLSNQSPDTDSRLRPETQDGMVAEITLTVSGDGMVESALAVQPTRVNLDGHVIEGVGPNHQPESANRTMDTLRSLGSCDPTALTP